MVRFRTRHQLGANRSNIGPRLQGPQQALPALHLLPEDRTALPSGRSQAAFSSRGCAFLYLRRVLPPPAGTLGTTEPNPLAGRGNTIPVKDLHWLCRVIVPCFGSPPCPECRSVCWGASPAVWRTSLTPDSEPHTRGVRSINCYTTCWYYLFVLGLGRIPPVYTSCNISPIYTPCNIPPPLHHPPCYWGAPLSSIVLR